MVAFVPPLIYYIAGIGGGVYFFKNESDEIQQVAKDVADKALEEGAQLVETTWATIGPLLSKFGEGLGDLGQYLGEGLEDLGEDIFNASQQIGNQTLEVIRGAIPAVIDGIDDGYDYIRQKLRGKEPLIISGLTVGLLTVLGAFYLLNAARRGTMAIE